MSLVARDYPKLAALVSLVLAHWPEHERFLTVSLGERDQIALRHAEHLAAMITRLATLVDGGLSTLARDYRFLCEEIVLPEELHFRRHGAYRLSRAQDALESVYQDRVFMTRYMNGLMMSDVLWANHALALQAYTEAFLSQLSAGASLLEIGPGHGLLLALAAKTKAVARLTAWDISEASLEASQRGLEALDCQTPVLFEQKDLFDPAVSAPDQAGRFDAIVLSEVLEHLEQPDRALAVLLHLVKPGGLVWINVPANSPAPDHLYLIREPAEAEALVRRAGFEIVQSAHFPMAGETLERAIRLQRTISCTITARRPAS